MAFPDLDGADQFILAEMSGTLNTQMPSHLPDFSDGNHSVTRAGQGVQIFRKQQLRPYIHIARNNDAGYGCRNIPHNSTPSVPHIAGWCEPARYGPVP